MLFPPPNVIAPPLLLIIEPIIEIEPPSLLSVSAQNVSTSFPELPLIDEFNDEFNKDIFLVALNVSASLPSPPLRDEFDKDISPVAFNASLSLLSPPLKKDEFVKNIF